MRAYSTWQKHGVITTSGSVAPVPAHPWKTEGGQDKANDGNLEMALFARLSIRACVFMMAPVTSDIFLNCSGLLQYVLQAWADFAVESIVSTMILPCLLGHWRMNTQLFYRKDVIQVQHCLPWPKIFVLYKSTQNGTLPTISHSLSQRNPSATRWDTVCVVLCDSE